MCEGECPLNFADLSNSFLNIDFAFFSVSESIIADNESFVSL